METKEREMETKPHDEETHPGTDAIEDLISGYGDGH